MSSRPPGMPLVAANWKMNPNNIDDALDLVRGILSVARGHADRVEVSIFPPFPWLLPVSEVLVPRSSRDSVRRTAPLRAVISADVLPHRIPGSRPRRQRAIAGRTCDLAVGRQTGWPGSTVRPRSASRSRASFDPVI